MSNNFYGAIALTGGGSGALDAIDGAGLADLDGAVVITATNLYIYSLDVDSGLAENSPNIIAPDNNPGNKRWILASSTLTGITIINGGTIGQAAGPLLTFDDTNNDLSLSGARFGIGTAVPDAELHVFGDIVMNANIQSAFNRYMGICGGGGVVGYTSGLKIENQANGNTLVHIQTANWGVAPSVKMTVDGTGYVFILVIKSGATQAAAGAAVNELWKTSGHATLPDNVVMIGV